MFLNVTSALEPRLKVLACLATLGEEKSVFELLRFVSPEDEKHLVESCHELLSINKAERTPLIAKELKKTLQAEKLSFLGEVHEDWFVEALKEEKRLGLGVLLQLVPSEKVKSILQALPEELKKNLPPLKQSSHIPPDLLQQIKRRFEVQFQLEGLFRKTEAPSLNWLYFLKLEELFLFFRKVGLEQLAKAFKALHKSVLRAILNRLLLKDAKELQKKVKALETLSSQELREAQMLILNLPLETIAAEDLFYEVGIAFCAKAFRHEDFMLVKALYHKITPKWAYLFKRYVDENLLLTKRTVAEWVGLKIFEKMAEIPLGAFQTHSL